MWFSTVVRSRVRLDGGIRLDNQIREHVRRVHWPPPVDVMFIVQGLFDHKPRLCCRVRDHVLVPIAKGGHGDAY